MLVDILLAPLIALFAPATSGAYDCDRLVAVGALAEAEAACADARGSVPLLMAIRRADRADRSKPEGLKLTLEGLRDTAEARQKAPDRVIEEALFQHFGRVVRALTPIEKRPDLAQWPLPDLPVPSPILPALEDDALSNLGAAIERSDERIREVEARLAGVDPDFARLPEAARQGLTRALEGLQAERARLLQRRLEALEKQVDSSKRPEPAQLLHLADTYFAVDADRPTKQARRKRGRRILRRLRRWYATDGAAGIAGLWLAAFALDDGDPRRARPLLDEAGPFDPGLSTFFESLLQWRRGKPEEALARLRSIRGPLSPALTAQVAALEGTLALETGDWASSAEAWLRAAGNAPAEQAMRARLRAAIAWSVAIASGENPRRVPGHLQASTLLHALSRGRMDAAGQLFTIMEKGRGPALPYIGLMLVDSHRAAGRGADADRLLNHLVRSYTGAGPWRSANLGPAADAARDALLRRIERRVARIVETGVPVPPAARALVGSIVAARFDLFQVSDRARVQLCEALGKLGFLEQVERHLVALRTGAADPLLRRKASMALVDAYVQRAREVGAAGAATGPWLLGAPIREPAPSEVTRLVEAQNELIGALPLGSVERDDLVVDRATVRLGLGDTDGIVAELEGVAERHPDTALGLRAIYQLMRARPDRIAQLGRRWSRRGAGPPARNRALRKALEAAIGDGPDPGSALMADGRFAEAAAAYAAAAEKSGPDAGSARLAAAVAWTAALRPDRAEPAWKAYIERHPQHAQVPVAHILFARLLQTQGKLADAAGAYIDSARLDGPDAGRALIRATELISGDFETLRAALGRLVRDLPNHPDHARYARALAALEGGHAPDAPVSGAPPTPPIAPGLCRGEACEAARFWPPAAGEAP